MEQEDLDVCWQDTRLIFGPLNTVYQELEKYSSIAEMWNAIPKDDMLWLGREGEGAVVLQSSTNKPYGATCYSLVVQRDILGYPKVIRLE